MTPEAVIIALRAHDVIIALRAHEPELRAAGVTRLSMFGSTARGEARPDSDIDLLAAFDEPGICHCSM